MKRVRVPSESHSRPLGAAQPAAYPEGIESFSPGLVGSADLPWVSSQSLQINPERVVSLSGGAILHAMPQSLAKILVHTVFSTKERRPFLRDRAIREEIHRYMGGILANLECQPIIVGGVEDHVHFLCALSRTIQVAEMVKEVKRGSSLWIKTKSPELEAFAWQNGYGAFSIGFSQIVTVRDYIARQEEHHRRISFQDEFRALLERYKIAYDERYVWD